MKFGSTAYSACVLQMRTTTECSYLAGAGPEGMGPLQHVALFHSHDTSRGRGVYALAMPMEHRSASHSHAASTSSQLRPQYASCHEFHVCRGLASCPALLCPALPCPNCTDLSVSRTGRQSPLQVTRVCLHVTFCLVLGDFTSHFSSLTTIGSAN